MPICVREPLLSQEHDIVQCKDSCVQHTSPASRPLGESSPEADFSSLVICVLSRIVGGRAKSVQQVGVRQRPPAGRFLRWWRTHR